jgi:hypothetical protein
MTNTAPADRLATALRANPRGQLVVGSTHRFHDGWRRDGSDLSQDRNGYRQIRSPTAESTPRDAMIAAMNETSRNQLADWSCVSTDYRSAYPSSYSDVYNHRAKEVSEDDCRRESEGGRW